MKTPEKNLRNEKGSESDKSPFLKGLNVDELITQFEEADKKNMVYLIIELGSELLIGLHNEVFAFKNTTNRIS